MEKKNEEYSNGHRQFSQEILSDIKRHFVIWDNNAGGEVYPRNVVSRVAKVIRVSGSKSSTVLLLLS